MKKDLILIGGGGHCRSVIDVIESTGDYKILGILDFQENVGKHILGYKIIGTDDDIPQLAEKHCNFVISVGQIKSSTVRQNIYKKVKNINGNLPVIIAKSATVSKHSIIEEGSIIHHNVFVNANVMIRKMGIVNTSTVIEHGSVIEDFCHISTNVTINGNCKVGSSTFIGSGTVLNNCISIGNCVVVASGSLVRKNISNNSLAVGNPMKIYNAK